MIYLLLGHWSTLGVFIGNGIHALDTGAVWGGKLTALRLEGEPEFITVDCAQPRNSDADPQSLDEMGDRD